MYAHHCTACGDYRLVFPSQIDSVSNAADGIQVAFTCGCGAPQTLVTGRRRTAQPVAA